MPHCWMVEGRQLDKDVQHWKLGFEALCIRVGYLGAKVHHREGQHG